MNLLHLNLHYLLCLLLKYLFLHLVKLMLYLVYFHLLYFNSNISWFIRIITIYNYFLHIFIPFSISVTNCSCNSCSNSFWCNTKISPICSLTVITGFSAERGSWKIIPISPPLISLNLFSEALVISSPFKTILPRPVLIDRNRPGGFTINYPLTDKAF